jgi:hypothetical protein
MNVKKNRPLTLTLSPEGARVTASRNDRAIGYRIANQVL